MKVTAEDDVNGIIEGSEFHKETTDTKGRKSTWWHTRSTIKDLVIFVLDVGHQGMAISNESLFLFVFYSIFHLSFPFPLLPLP